MTVIFTETWTGADGAAWPAQWALGRNASTGGSVTIVGNQGRMVTGDAGAFAGGDRVSRRYTSTILDAEVLVALTNRISGGFPRVIFRSSTTALDTTRGYNLDINASTGYQWISNPAGTGTALGTRVAYTLPVDTKHWLRARVVGNTLRAKMWADGNAEPSEWPAGADLVNSDITAAGYLGLTLGGGSATARTLDFDDLTVTDGESVPLAPIADRYYRIGGVLVESRRRYREGGVLND